ncbi:MAG: hypothetical protein ACO3QB_12890, partial [bacterium]
SKVPNFLIFLVQSIPSPTICDCPPSPSWARVLIIDFLYQFDIFVEKQPVRLLPSPEGEGGQQAG